VVGVWSGTKLSVDVSVDEHQGSLDPVKIRGKQQLVRREIFHSLIDLMHDVDSGLFQTSISDETDDCMIPLRVPKAIS